MASMRFIPLFLLLTLSVSGMPVDTVFNSHTVPPFNAPYWLERPVATRYFFAPTGYNVRRHQGYYENIWGILNQATYGFTDYFSTGLSVIPIIGLGPFLAPVWVTPKLSMPIGKEQGAIGVTGVLGTIIGVQPSGFGGVYGVGTLGDRDRNISLGAGYFGAVGAWSDKPAITLSGMYRISNKWILQSENYYIGTHNSPVWLAAFGAKWSSSSIAVDFGLIRNFAASESDFFQFIPWLCLSLPFGDVD